MKNKDMTMGKKWDLFYTNQPRALQRFARAADVRARSHELSGAFSASAVLSERT